MVCVFHAWPVRLGPGPDAASGNSGNQPTSHGFLEDLLHHTWHDTIYQLNLTQLCLNIKSWCASCRKSHINSQQDHNTTFDWEGCMKCNFSVTLLLECSLGPKEWPKLGTKDSVHLCLTLGGEDLTHQFSKRNRFSNTKTWWKFKQDLILSMLIGLPQPLSSVHLTVAANKQASAPTATSTHSKPKKWQLAQIP